MVSGFRVSGCRVGILVVGSLNPPNLNFCADKLCLNMAASSGLT